VTWHARRPSPRARFLFLSLHCNCSKELGMTELAPELNAFALILLLISAPDTSVGLMDRHDSWHIPSRFFSAASLSECTMNKLMGRTGGTGMQCRGADRMPPVRSPEEINLALRSRTKAS
jgi:hypothetical protein